MAAGWQRVEDAVRGAEARHGCVLGVTVVAPGGVRWAHNEERSFVAASTVKIPIMIELFRQADAGALHLADLHVLEARDKAPGSGVVQHLHEGLTFTLEDLCYLMISISDNTATNLLIDRLGMQAVNATMQRLGMRASCLGRKMMGRRASETETENLATSADYATVVAALWSRHAGTPSACEAMLDLLRKQQNARRIGRHVSSREGARWGSKTGSLPGVTNDVGFIETGHGVLILSVFCDCLADVHMAEQIIGDVSLAALQASAEERL